jgi:PIN domain nuclease of toxin-antitoxin system
MSKIIVLDTHIWYWWVNLEHHRLGPHLLTAIENAPCVGVSAVSCFELALAHRRKRLELPLALPDWFAYALEGSQIELFPLTREISAQAVALSEIHRDPFDRIIIATAIAFDAALASVDGHFSAYPELAKRLLVS